MLFVSNLLKDIRSAYIQELASMYAPKEVQSLFSITAQTLEKCSPAELLLRLQEPVNESVLIKYSNVLKRLKKGMPLQYALKQTTFCDMQFHVTPDVLIPRPETEELVMLIQKDSHIFSRKILDIGTGSGCIAITLKKIFPLATVSAMDVSEAAIAVARKNAITLNQDIDFIHDSVLAPSYSYSSYDIIVSNPPYVMDSEKNKMHTNVLDFEPHLALFVKDEDPLLFYRAILEFAIKHLSKKGVLYFEINEQQGLQMVQLCKHFGFEHVTCIKDIHGKDRFIKAKQV